MNINEFLNIVDTRIEQMTKKELEDFVHLLARKTGETQREKFIQYLSIANKPIQNEENVVAETNAKITYVLKEFKKVKQKEICIEGSFNEYYDDWYDDMDEAYIFSNTEEIQSIIITACDVLKAAIEIKLYDEAYRLSNEMMDLKVGISGDYAENVQEHMQLNELYEMDILQFDFYSVGLHTLYLKYIIKTGKERIREIYNTLLYFNSVNLKIEQMMQAGYNDLPDVDKFLNGWIAYLGAINNKYSQKFIKEAMSLLDNSDDKISIAEKYSKAHPGLYEELMIEGNSFSDEQLLKIGSDALGHIPVELVVRSRIALMTAECAFRLNKPDVAYNCLIEAFRSDTTPTNYLRIVFNCENYINLIPVMMEIYNDSLSKLNKTFLDRTDELCRNIVNDNNYYSLLFLGREFDRVFKFGKNTMGNNCSIVSAKCALSLLLIYFYDGADMMPGIRAMCLKAVENIDFKPDKYFFLNVEKPENIKPEELLFECIKKWKQYANSGYDYKEECMKYIGKEIHTNTANMLKQQARSFYGDCASYIAAFGEVNDSLGNNSGGKDVLVDQYLKEFPRYSAFRRELQYFTAKN